MFSGPAAGAGVTGVAAPVKRPAGFSHCGHLGVLNPAPLQRAGRVEGAAGTLGAVEEGRKRDLFKAKRYEGCQYTRLMAVVMVPL